MPASAGTFMTKTAAATMLRAGRNGALNSGRRCTTTASIQTSARSLPAVRPASLFSSSKFLHRRPLPSSSLSPSSIFSSQRRCFSSPTLARYAASADTKDFKFNHTMLRVKDPKASLHFYTEILGMDLIDEHDAGDFKLFFLAYSNSPTAQAPSRRHREAILELTWNKGTEKEEKTPYTSGNEEGKQGFGHIAISVPNLKDSVAYFDKHNVQFKKRPEDGKMRNIAFIFDPDGYWIEVIAMDNKDV